MESLTTARLKLAVRGAVQGVGFRPYVYRLATGLGLAGWVNNSSAGVLLEVEGPRAQVETFLVRFEAGKPPRSFIQSLESSWLDPVGYSHFEIRESDASGAKTALVLPDIATCAECVAEIFDQHNRRFRYPFTNCTNCGPRFSIIESLPYDRANTVMKQFALCPECRAEFENPLDRRFHAQPNACPVCGPQLELWDRRGKTLEKGDAALLAAAQQIRSGGIVALKGLGGFQLLVAADNGEAVRRLRGLKHREQKPFAVMFPQFELVQRVCEISPLEERLLRSAEAPIVLLRRLQDVVTHPLTPTLSPNGGEGVKTWRREVAASSASLLAQEVAPGNPCVGVMLPYTPLHHLLMTELNFPVVATSGNISNEPICIDEQEAVKRLGEIADVLLVHNRPIVRAVDDSVTRVMLGREMILRRARGYAPLPITLRAGEGAPTILAVGAHLKNTVALGIGPQIFISQHIGDLETIAAHEAFVRIGVDLQNLFEARPTVIAHDTHPDYLSTKFAAELLAKNPTWRGVSVQHHAAHVLACMADNELEPPVLGVAWDGTGYGDDGTIWGGEFLQVTATGIARRAHLRTFPLLGSETAINEPRRIAVSLWHEIPNARDFYQLIENSEGGFSSAQLLILEKMLKGKFNSPTTSSVGRLFDGVASLAGLRHKVSFEGQAAMELEFALEGIEIDEAYPFTIADGDKVGAPLVLDWRAMVEAILTDRKRGVPVREISAKFHNALVEGIVGVAQRVGERQVALTGGCFQNRYLTERAVKRLTAEGFRAYWHQRVPPNDGGIAPGQILAVLRSKP